MIFHKKTKLPPYNPAVQKAVLKSSICTGEQVAGFKDITTNKFTDVMLIRNQGDLDTFLKTYKIKSEDMSKEY